MRSLFLITAILAFTGCTTGDDDDPMLPDADLGRDGGRMDGAPPADGGFPPPVEETCTAEGMGSTLGDACTTADDCDDGCFCNGSEACAGDVCVTGGDPCTDTVECTEEACLEETNTCYRQPVHAMCEDGDRCNGDEICDPTMGCRAASAPECNDENTCTVDSCDVEMGCVYSPRDLDEDGFMDGRCGGDDCDDDPRYGRDIYPGATEICDNRRDDDCDGMRDYTDMADCAPTNNRCDSARVLPGPGTYSGSTVGLTSDYTLSCFTGTGPDAIFRFTLTEPHDVRVTVAGGGGGGHGAPTVAVALRTFAQCAAGPDDKCNAGAPPSFLRRSLPAGDYAIIVKTPTASTFDLSLMITDPTPIPPIDRCSDMTEDVTVAASVAGGARYMGRFEETEDDYRLSCHTPGGTTFRDAAYRFVITEPKDLLARATVAGGGEVWETPLPYLALIQDPPGCGSGTSLQCVGGSAAMAEVRRRGLAPGTYYLLIEGSLDDTQEWALTVALTDPLARTAGDACVTALDITDRTQMVNLAMMEFDSGTSCGGTAMTYRDAFFYFETTELRDVTVTASGGGTMYVSTGTVCGSPTGDLRCRNGGSPLSYTFRSLEPGRYFVTVATTSSLGTLSVSATTGPPTPIPPNDRCAGAINFTEAGGTRLMDTLVGFSDDLAGCSGTGYVDAFYSITLASRRRVLISAQRTSGTAPLYLTLRALCGVGISLGCMSGSPANLTITLDPGTYYLMVESPEMLASDFRIDVATLPP